MTSETLLPCWSCGSENIGPTGGLRIIMCGDCGAGPDEEWIWQRRALRPALDTVIEAVEAKKGASEGYWSDEPWLTALDALRVLRGESGE